MFGAVTGLDDEQVLSVIRAAPQSHPLTLLTLSPAAYVTLRAKLGGSPGCSCAGCPAACSTPPPPT